MSMLQSALMQIVFWVVWISALLLSQQFGFVVAVAIAFVLALASAVPFLKVGRFEQVM